MPKKKVNLVLILGIACNVVAVLLLLYFFYVSVPKKNDLKSFPPVAVPQIDNDVLKNEVNNLDKATGWPIEIDKSKLGKKDPYF